jgi:FKBP-type peptidyl-prolyl cis-trans isomerase FklB
MILQICMRVLALFTLIGMLGFSTSLKALQNVSADEAYIIENAKKPGWIIRPSGLQIKILTRGTGRLPSPTSDVVVHYTGKFIDGTIFDSSVERGQPTTFPVNGVINGWVEALKLMKEGSKWSLVIPSKLGYGEEGSGDRIYPNATLLFEVEMLEVKIPLVTGFKK